MAFPLKDHNTSMCMYLTRSKKKNQESEKYVIIGKNREKTSLQPLPNSKRETVRNKLTCWLNDLHLKLCKERLVYQFNPAYKCQSSMILPKEVYLRILKKFPSLSKMIKACGLISSINSGMTIKSPREIWQEEFCTLLRSSQSHFPSGIEKTGNVMVNNIKMLQIRLSPIASYDNGSTNPIPVISADDLVKIKFIRDAHKLSSYDLKSTHYIKKATNVVKS